MNQKQEAISKSIQPKKAFLLGSPRKNEPSQD